MPFSHLRTDSPCRSALLIVSVVATLLSTGRSSAAGASLAQDVQAREVSGDLAGARSLLETQAADGGNASAAAALAQFLDRHGDPARRDAYLKWAALESDPEKQRLALRQAVLIDFMQGKKNDLAGDLDRYKAAGGSDLVIPSATAKPSGYSTIMIPGPLSSFARMAALSTDLNPRDLLPALARNVVTNGYEASGNELLQQTEYLRLLTRYVAEARELQALARNGNKIVIPTCDSEETGALLKILGYRMRGSCGADIVLETVNPTRAFLTVDSGFPLTQLEQDLRGNHRFELPYAPTPIPVLYGPNYWLAAVGRDAQSDFFDAFTSDPTLCRLYLGLSHVDPEVAEALRSRSTSAKLRLYASVLDFYGGMFQIRNGAAVVPGPAKVWASMVGAQPSNPGQFFDKLLTTDDGWLASYFDALSRMEDGPVLSYLTQPERLKRFYDALRGKITVPGPARPVFRSSTDLMLLTTGLQLDANGAPHIPGNLEVWRTLFIKHPHGKYDGKLTRAAANWRNSDDLLEALFALSRKTADNEPLHIFLAVNDVDRGRSKPVSVELAARLVNSYRAYGSQYRLFADAPNLSEASVTLYLDQCAEISSARESLVKDDAAGTLQALVELWSILCRNNLIPMEKQDAAFASLIKPFVRMKQEFDVFAAGRGGVEVLLSATDVQGTGSREEKLVEMMVGPLHPSGEAGPSQAESFFRILDAQRLLPLDALFTVADRLGKGDLDPKTAKTINDQLGRLEEAETVHSSISRDEKTTSAAGYWSDKHIDQELKFSLDSVMKNADKKDGRGALAPFLRDTLVGMVYAYYAPAGAEILFTNPMFVRSHDFAGPEGTQSFWRATEVSGAGWPASSGGKLTGSLVSLPYALAQAEQNFLTPRREQALIWADLVPQIIMNVTVTRWKDVTPDQVRWVALHIRRGWNLLAAAGMNPSVEPRVAESIGRFMTPAGVHQVRDCLREGDFALALSQMPPSYVYALGSDTRLSDIAPDIESVEIAELAARDEPQLSPRSLAHTFGTAKPTLTHSYRPGLLYLRTFPALMGYSSRILAETWESNNLYYAVLADEAGIPAARLDTYVPQWNQSAIENIFATHLEDWPALIRSLNLTADSVLHRNNQRAALTVSGN